MNRYILMQGNTHIGSIWCTRHEYNSTIKQHTFYREKDLIASLWGDYEITEEYQECTL